MMICPICLNETDTVLSDKLRRGHGKVFYCSACDLGFLEKFIENSKEYYDNDYRLEYSHNAELNETNAKELFEIYVNYQTDRLKIVEPYLGPDKNLIEVGASSGMFIAHVLDKCKSISAIEFDSKCVEFIRQRFKIDADDKPLNESYLSNFSYDIVCSFQVLEHTDEPITFLNQLYDVLKPGGYAFIEIPNLYDPLLSIWNVPYYRQFYYHSAHNYYFSEKSLKIILSRTKFDLEQIIYLQDYNILNHINWVLNNSPQKTCEIGLNPPMLTAIDNDFSNWFNKELELFNKKYIEKLQTLKKTSNIMIVLKK